MKSGIEPQIVPTTGSQPAPGGSDTLAGNSRLVAAGLVPAVHAFDAAGFRSWMPGTRRHEARRDKSKISGTAEGVSPAGRIGKLAWFHRKESAR
jgi:hypothetical protein